MSIDKESNGLPGFDSRRRTTKVNLGIIAAVVIFLVLMGFVARHTRRDAAPAPQPAAVRP